MQLHRSFGQAKLGPIKHRGAEIDHRGIQAQQGILESEFPLLPRSWLAGRQALALGQQLLKDRLLQLPRPMFVGVGQRGASRSRWQTQVPKFPFTRGQASADFTQGLGVPQLTKKHGNELTPATETTGRRSASCRRTADSNSKRGINCRICEKILLTRVKAEPPFSVVIGFCRAQPQAIRCSAFSSSQFQIPIWTGVL